jgi:hypothetical protein
MISLSMKSLGSRPDSAVEAKDITSKFVNDAMFEGNDPEKTSMTVHMRR